jgi:hypothetical protein
MNDMFVEQLENVALSTFLTDRRGTFDNVLWRLNGGTFDDYPASFTVYDEYDNLQEEYIAQAILNLYWALWDTVNDAKKDLLK